MNILAIDTATEILSVALCCDCDENTARATAPRATTSGSERGRAGSTRFLEETRDIGLRHARTLMPSVDRLLVEAALKPVNLDLVACMRGPGSFTGLRIGMSTAKGLAAAVAQMRGLKRPRIVSVSTLDVMAHAVPVSAGVVVPVIDGRKNRFYAAVFRDGRRVTDDLDLEAEAVLGVARSHALAGTVPKSLTITGPHADTFVSRLVDTVNLTVDPAFRRGNAAALVSLAVREFLSRGPDEPSQGPVYVRGSDAELSLG